MVLSVARSRLSGKVVSLHLILRSTVRLGIHSVFEKNSVC